MRSKIALAAGVLALAAAGSRLVANPVGVPPTAKPFDVIEGKKVAIELGTPTAHGWYVLVWGSYAAIRLAIRRSSRAAPPRKASSTRAPGASMSPGRAGASVSSPPRTRATERTNSSSRYVAGRRSRWAWFRPQARKAFFTTGSTTRHKRGRRTSRPPRPSGTALGRDGLSPEPHGRQRR